MVNKCRIKAVFFISGVNVGFVGKTLYYVVMN